jgi:hypothetical protein
VRALASEMYRLVEEHEARSICAPPFEWLDCEDDSQKYVGAATKDGEWIVVTRVTKRRGEITRFEIPREAILYLAKQLGLHE